VLVSKDIREILRDFAEAASDTGPAIAPVGHLELLQSITDTARAIFNAAACSLALLDESNELLVFHVASGAGADEVVGRTVPVNQGIAGWVVTSGQPIEIVDVTQDPRFASGFASETGYVPRSILAMPLETEREMIGAIEVLDRDRSADSNADMQLLGHFARQGALAIEASRVFTNLGREMLRSLARLTDDASLQDAFHGAAEQARRPDESLVMLAAHFNELARMGDQERAAATGLVGEFLRYLGTRDNRRP
jgi:GAF domain-containing protein